MLYRNLLQAAVCYAVSPQAVAQGGDPEVARFIRVQRRDGLARECVGKRLVSTKLVACGMRYGPALVCGAEPQVAVFVPEYGTHLRIRNLEREIRVCLICKVFPGAVVAEESFADGVKQDVIICS